MLHFLELIAFHNLKSASQEVFNLGKIPYFLYFNASDGSLNYSSMNLCKMWPSPTSFIKAENILAGNLA